MTSVIMRVEEIARVQEILKSFPQVEVISIRRTGESGIGCLLDMDFDYEVNGTDVRVRVKITDESDW